MLTTKRLVIAAALFSLSASGCALLRNLFSAAFVSPTLTFRSATLADASLSGATLHLTYALKNPNQVGLRLAHVDYTLLVEGKQVVAGSPPNGLQLAPNGVTELTFPASVRFAELAPVLVTFLTQDKARFQARGTLGLDTPIGLLKLPLEKEGEFEVPKVPALSLGMPRIASMTFQSASLELPLSLTNRNSYPLPIGAIGGSFTLGGSAIGTLSSNELGWLQPGETKSLTLPLSFSLANALSAARALQSGSGTLGFEGQLQSGGVAIPVRLSQLVSFRR